MEKVSGLYDHTQPMSSVDTMVIWGSNIFADLLVDRK
jgi:hypothetical protein